MADVALWFDWGVKIIESFSIVSGNRVHVKHFVARNRVCLEAQMLGHILVLAVAVDLRRIFAV